VSRQFLRGVNQLADAVKITPLVPKEQRRSSVRRMAAPDNTQRWCLTAWRKDELKGFNLEKQQNGATESVREVASKTKATCLPRWNTPRPCWPQAIYRKV